MKVIKSEVLKNNKISSDDIVVKTDIKKGKVLTNCFKKELMMAYVDNRITVSHPTSYHFAKINLDSEKSTTSKLTLDDGKVKIGKGVKKILVSAMINIWRNSGAGDVQTDIRQAGIKHKNKTYFSSFYISGTNLGQSSHFIPNLLLEVEENDEIELFDNIGPAIGTSTILGDKGSGTYVTIEILE